MSSVESGINCSFSLKVLTSTLHRITHKADDFSIEVFHQYSTVQFLFWVILDEPFLCAF